MDSPRKFLDYYQLLGVPFGAKRETIQKSFRTLAKKYHPDNPHSGSREIFQNLLEGYKTLTSEDSRANYDRWYLEYRKKQHLIQVTTKNPKEKKDYRVGKRIPPNRVQYVHSLVEFARRGLMRKGYRMKDRRKLTGNLHDFEILILESEKDQYLTAFIPQIVRVLCPECKGSDIHCEACNGRGSYKSFRNIQLDIIPGMWQDGQIWEIHLRSLRPDRFTYFKKKTIKVLLRVKK